MLKQAAAAGILLSCSECLTIKKQDTDVVVVVVAVCVGPAAATLLVAIPIGYN
jgi:hypothetical protein